MANAIWIDINGNPTKFVEAMEKAKQATDSLEKKISMLAGSFVGLSAVYKVVDYIKHATEEYTKIAQQQATLVNMLKNEHNLRAANVNLMKEQVRQYVQYNVSAEKTMDAMAIFYEKYPTAGTGF